MPSAEHNAAQLQLLNVSRDRVLTGQKVVSQSSESGALPGHVQDKPQSVGTGDEYDPRNPPVEEAILASGALSGLGRTMSARALANILALKENLVTIIPARNAAVVHVDDTVNEREIRDLLGKSLLWFSRREHIKMGGVYLVLVEQEDAEDARTTHPDDAKNAEVPDGFSAFTYRAEERSSRGYAHTVWVGRTLSATLVVLFLATTYMYLVQMWNALAL